MNRHYALTTYIIKEMLKSGKVGGGVHKEHLEKKLNEDDSERIDIAIVSLVQ